MSVARKRAKVKKKRSAKKKVIPRKGNTSPKGKTTSKKKKRVSVNTKPRPRKPKPRNTSKKRSEAAKKGWETRRTNQLRAEAKTSREAHIAFLQRPQVAAQITDDLIRTGLVRPGMVQSDETQMLSRMIVAKQLGNFDETAQDLAIEFDWDVRDVYTLWNSP